MYIGTVIKKAEDNAGEEFHRIKQKNIAQLIKEYSFFYDPKSRFKSVKFSISKKGEYVR